jgi:hypothetical protein
MALVAGDHERAEAECDRSDDELPAPDARSESSDGSEARAASRARVVPARCAALARGVRDWRRWARELRDVLLGTACLAWLLWRWSRGEA